MTSLEGVWRTGVRAAELETLVLLSSRGYPLLTVANGPLMARRFQLARVRWLSDRPFSRGISRVGQQDVSG
jgi:hypothetical protein